MRKFLLSGLTFVITGVLILPAGYLNSRNIDINLHDTYIVIATSSLAGVFFLWFMVVALIFFLFHFLKKPLFLIPGIIQYISMTSFVIGIGVALNFFAHQASIAAYYLVALLALFCLVGQIVFIGNIIMTLLRRK